MNIKDQLDHDYLMAQIANLMAQNAHLMAQTAKVNKDLKWYEVGVVVAATLAVVALVKGVL